MRWILWLPIALLTTATFAGELAVKVTVTEPAGIARKGEPAWGGVPFRKGQVKNVKDLALFAKSGAAVPAQFSKLAGYEDGSVQWALVDVLVSLPAKGKAEFVVKKGKAAAPGKPLKIVEAGEKVTVNTGVGEFVLSKTAFVLFEAKVGGKKVAGPGALEVTDAAGKVFRAAKPTKVSWEYKGPLRATLRFEGAYQDHPLLFYTARLTFWSGSSTVRLVHSLRNSHPKAGADAKIKSATISLSLADKGAAAKKGGDWALAGGTLVAHRHTGGCFPGGGRKIVRKQEVAGGKATVWAVPPGGKGPGYGADHFALADRAHKETTVWFDFGPSAADGEARSKALRSWLHALTDGAWISETESLGSFRFGTLADEVATYKKWGWKGYDNPKKLPRSKHNPGAYTSKVWVHDVSETDSAEGYCLMYVRTGQRGFLDGADAYTSYFRTHYAYRTDGFDFAAKGRRNKGAKFGWHGPRSYSWADSRAEKCHFYGRGIFDYYCLTGDVDALEGGMDLLEQCAAMAKRYKPGAKIGYWGVRGFARMWLTPIRGAQLTRKPEEMKIARLFADVAIKASDWDPRGFVKWGAGPAYVSKKGGWLDSAKWPPRLKKYMEEKGRTLSSKGVVQCKDGTSWSITSDGGTWQQAALQAAYYRYWKLSGDEESKKRILKLAEFGRDCQFSKKCQQTHYYTMMDFPDKGKPYDAGAWSDAHKNCPGPGAKHSGWYTRFYPNVFARAYEITKDKKWLDSAKLVWDRGSKRGYQRTKQSAPPDQVGVFASHRAPKDDSILSTSQMFYFVPRAK